MLSEMKSAPDAEQVIGDGKRGGNPACHIVKDDIERTSSPRESRARRPTGSPPDRHTPRRETALEGTFSGRLRGHHPALRPMHEATRRPSSRSRIELQDPPRADGPRSGGGVSHEGSHMGKPIREAKSPSPQNGISRGETRRRTPRFGMNHSR